jgi:hypothetical protein
MTAVISNKEGGSIINKKYSTVWRKNIRQVIYEEGEKFMCVL